jgi:hypothetical protein
VYPSGESGRQEYADQDGESCQSANPLAGWPGGHTGWRAQWRSGQGFSFEVHRYSRALGSTANPIRSRVAGPRIANSRSG